MLIFQFTLPREERRQVQAQPLTLQNFNPRSHERSDFLVLTSKRLILYFNPRSHERSDCYSNISLTFSSYFNPRSHERSDATTLRQGIYRLNFNPRSHERSDKSSFCSIGSSAYFNPRSHERSDIVYCYRFKYIRISIHAPTRGATIPRHPVNVTL